MRWVWLPLLVALAAGCLLPELEKSVPLDAGADASTTGGGGAVTQGGSSGAVGGGGGVAGQGGAAGQGG